MTSVAMTPVVQRLGADRADEVRAFLRTHYGDGHYGAEARYFDWLYLQCPPAWFGPERQRGLMPVNAILDQDGAVAAVHAFVPFAARTPWGGDVGIWDVEWINGSGIRGGGRALAAALLAEVDVYAGFGCNDLSAQAFARMGMTVVPEIHRLAAVLDGPGFNALLAAHGLSAEATVPAQVPALSARYSLLAGAAAVPAAALDDYGARTPFGAARDADWLEWRYDRHPYISYAAIDTGCGAAVLRLESVVGTDAVVCRMLEFLPRAGAEAETLAAAMAFGRDRGALLFDTFATSAAHAALVGAAAAANAIDLRMNARLPYMFQPLEFGHTNAPNMVIATGGRAAAAIVDFGTFQAGKGDSNQDVLRDSSTAPRLRGHHYGK